MALLLSPTARIGVSRTPPANASHDSFAQITRLQRLVSGTRRVILRHDPTLPRGTMLCFWQIPRLAEYGFQGPNALRVWYRDSTLTWDRFGGMRGLNRRFGAALEFLPEEPQVAMAINLRAFELYQQGLLAITQARLDAGDSLLALVERIQTPRTGKFLGTTVYNRARIALMRADLAAADSIDRVAESIGLEPEDHWAFAAYLALRKGDRVAATQAARQLLAMAPEHPDAAPLAELLGLKR